MKKIIIIIVVGFCVTCSYADWLELEKIIGSDTDYYDYFGNLKQLAHYEDDLLEGLVLVAKRLGDENLKRKISQIIAIANFEESE